MPTVQTRAPAQKYAYTMRTREPGAFWPHRDALTDLYVAKRRRKSNVSAHMCAICWRPVGLQRRPNAVNGRTHAVRTGTGRGTPKRMPAIRRVDRRVRRPNRAGPPAANDGADKALARAFACVCVACVSDKMFCQSRAGAHTASHPPMKHHVAAQ